jgi:hypothetical protein
MAKVTVGQIEAAYQRIAPHAGRVARVLSGRNIAPEKFPNIMEERQSDPPLPD